MENLVIDTDVVSYGFRQEAVFTERYGPALEGSRSIISFMTIAELQFGMLNRNWGKDRCQKLVHYLRTHFVQYGVTEDICHAWAEIAWDAKQQGRVIQTADAWIAATAVSLGVPLVTHNARDFDYLSNLQLITFPTQ